MPDTSWSQPAKHQKHADKRHGTPPPFSSFILSLLSVDRSVGRHEHVVGNAWLPPILLLPDRLCDIMSSASSHHSESLTTTITGCYSEPVTSAMYLILAGMPPKIQ
mmetsp:Transcript_17199/g.41759  ORF Transcript_17199/g.41759 Transcript_17199/m.41759 type:complete len:106 (-) Transcript_17199:1149-1466(-)